MTSVTSQTGKTSLLSIRQLEVAIAQRTREHRNRAVTLLDDINLEVARGEVCALVGESGAGKSMIARTILGLLPEAAKVVKGEVLFDNTPLLIKGKLKGRGIIGKQISLIPQDPMVALNPVRSIERQMCDVMQMHLGLTTQAARERALEMLTEVLIRDPKRVLESYPHELSGGMRQRVLIATAFAVNPKLIIADEPTTALDVTVQKRVLQLLRKLQRKHNTAVLFVTHDLGVVAKISDQVAVLRFGKILEYSNVQALFSKPEHPYTKALLEATPRYDRANKPLQPVPDGNHD